MTPQSLAELQQPDWRWFDDARFGLFIHWGLYALAARHEWVKNAERITDADYEKYFRYFDPDLYDPTDWARAARRAGMKYFVITTKHHEGFCLWDTKESDYKAPNTRAGRDLIRPMIEAFRAEGLRVGLYHSIIDWHHPDYGVDRLHPQRDNAEERARNPQRDIARYRAYLHAQVRELLTDYGKIDYLFFDFSYPGEDGKGRKDWGSEDLLRMVRTLQPHIIVNDRLDLSDVPGGWDIKTPEQLMVRESPKEGGERVRWETCQTFSGSWGYHRDEASWKSVRQCLYLLIDTVSKDGNLLLNVGPTARGEFDARAMERLDGMGEWLRVHGRSIYGCGSAPPEFVAPHNGILTFNPRLNRLYLHLVDWPIRELYLDGYGGKVKYAQLMNDASEVPFGALEPWQSHWQAGGEDTLSLRLPVLKPDVEIPVIEMFLD